MSKKKLLVFLSHASEDKPKVRKLCKQLLADGFDPWLDEERLLPGQDWNFEIEQALRKSDSILLCFSADSSSKEGYIQREYKRAMNYQLEKPEGSIFVIPVRLGECEIPFFLRELQCVDYPLGYSRLITSLNARAGKVAKTAKAKATRSPINDKHKREDFKHVQLVLEGEFVDFNETRQEDLIAVLSSLLHIDAESVRILQVTSGSVVVVLEMPREAAGKLAELAIIGDPRLDAIKIKSIRLEGQQEILAIETRSFDYSEDELRLIDLFTEDLHKRKKVISEHFFIDQIAKNSNSINLRYFYSQYLKNSKRDISESIRWLEAIKEQNENHPEVLISLIECYSAQEAPDFEKASPYLDKLKDIKDETIKIRLANFYIKWSTKLRMEKVVDPLEEHIRQRKYKDLARNALDLLRDVKPRTSRIYFLFAQSYFNLWAYDEAHEMIKKAIEKSDNQGDFQKKYKRFEEIIVSNAKSHKD